MITDADGFNAWWCDTCTGRRNGVARATWRVSNGPGAENYLRVCANHLNNACMRLKSRGPRLDLEYLL